MIRKRGELWHLDTTVAGIRHREPLKTTDRREARELAKRRIAEIMSGKGASVAGKEFARLGFSKAMEKLREARKPHIAERTVEIDRERAKPLCKYFGDRQLNRITAADVAAYQTARTSGTGFDRPVAGRTVNMEIALLRILLERAKLWSRIAEDVKALPENLAPPIGRALTAEELRHLATVAATRPEWLVARAAMGVSLATSGRGVELKHLKWEHVDLFAGVLKFVRSKTAAGQRTIPLSADGMQALALLRRRSEALQAAEPEHFVFCACERGKIDPTKPMKGWRTAWRSLTAEAARLAGEAAERAGADRASAEKPFRGLRFHDLRHTAVSLMATAGVSSAAIMSISGHLSKRMVEHSTHIGLAAKKEAVAHLPSGIFAQEEKPEGRIVLRPQ
jgi:integrase